MGNEFSGDDEVGDTVQDQLTSHSQQPGEYRKKNILTDPMPSRMHRTLSVGTGMESKRIQRPRNNRAASQVASVFPNLGALRQLSEWDNKSDSVPSSHAEVNAENLDVFQKVTFDIFVAFEKYVHPNLFFSFVIALSEATNKFLWASFRSGRLTHIFFIYWFIFNSVPVSCQNHCINFTSLIRNRQLSYYSIST